MLAFDDVTRRYGRVQALSGASFELAPGSLTALLGANGAGKSTLLRVAASLESPSRGTVRVDGLDAKQGGAEYRRRIAYLGQEPALYGELTVRENLEFSASFHRKEFALDHAADVCGISRKLDERARRLSRGERQRAALARALCAGDLLLLDEPTTALDTAGRSQVADLLADLHGARTALVATHDAHLLGIADRALVLDAGRIILDGDADAGRAWLEARA